MIEFDKNVEEILGRPNFTCGRIAQKLREQGRKIETSSEKEQAAVIYWLLCLYEKHGQEYKKIGNEILKSSAKDSETQNTTTQGQN